ncbi:MAG: hypothetical protein WBL88_06510, partial [Nitrososphaeraceae archaeon]
VKADYKTNPADRTSYDIVEKKMDQSTLDSQELEKIKAEYNSLIHNYGAEIKSVTRIVRTELESPGIMLVLHPASFSQNYLLALLLLQHQSLNILKMNFLI